MNILRQILVFVAASIFGLLLYANVTIIALTLTLGSPDKVKSVLNQSGVYDNFLSGLVEQTSNPNSEQKDGLDLSKPEIRSIAEKSFSASVFKSAGDNLVDGTFNWLNGRADKPDFKIDFSAPTNQFTVALGDYLENRLNSLPPCSVAAIPEQVDPFSVSCRPPGLNVAQEVNKFEQDLLGSAEFLNKPITIDGDQTQPKDPNKPPIYENLDWLPRLYQLRPWLIFAALAGTVLTAAIMVFGSSERARGWRRIAHSLAVTGVLLIVSVVVFSFLAKKGFGDNQPALTRLTIPILTGIIHQINKIVLVFGGAYTALAIAIYIFIRRATNPSK